MSRTRGVAVVDLDAGEGEPRARILRAGDPEAGVAVVAVSRDPALAAVALAAGAEFALLPRDARWLEETVRRAGASGPPAERLVVEVPAEGLRYEEYERRLIAHALERTGWNRSRTARELGIGRPRLARKIARYGLRDPGASEARS